MTTARRALLFAAGALVGAVAYGCIASTRRYRGAVSDHFDGRRFRNETPTEHAGFGDFVKWMSTREPGPWRKWEDVPPVPSPPRRVGRGEMRVTFVNHATVLVQMDGVNILTDPIWSERCSPVSFAGPRRVHPPGLRFEQLPPIDVVLVSHNHYDHLDLPTLERLAAGHRPRFVVPLGNRAIFDRAKVGNVEELDWWQSIEVREGIRVAAVPTQHFSGRGLSDRDRALWAGFVITGPAGAMYFAGDSGFGPHFEEIRDRYGPPRLALLPIGAYRPEWFMSRVHTSELFAWRTTARTRRRRGSRRHFARALSRRRSSGSSDSAKRATCPHTLRRRSRRDRPSVPRFKQSRARPAPMRELRVRTRRIR